MTIHCNTTSQNDIFQQPFVSNKETVEKTDRIAIDLITQYLNNVDNSMGLQSSIEDSFENLEHIIECDEYISTMGSPDSSPLSIQYADRALQRDFDSVLEVVQWDGLELQYASKRLQNNYHIVLQAVQQNGFAIQHASRKLQNSYYIALSAVRQNGLALQYLSRKQRDHFDIAAGAIRQNYLALSFVSPRLQDDDEIIRFSVWAKKNTLPYPIIIAR